MVSPQSLVGVTPLLGQTRSRLFNLMPGYCQCHRGPASGPSYANGFIEIEIGIEIGFGIGIEIGNEIEVPYLFDFG
jgi:hypothetical protein